MTPIALEDIRRAVDGKIVGAADRVITGVSRDNREIEPGHLYVALRGERFDGHAFLADAVAAGAVAAIVDHQPLDLPENFACIVVPDTRRAMGKLAAFVRQALSSQVVAVAGSNGKTGTKHLIDAALRGVLRGSISPKSYNNDIGVPVTIFAAQADHDYLVLEVGTNHHGEIAWLAEIARPDIAVITNCSAEHLEGLDDLSGVRRENASILGGLRPGGLLVVNGDDPELLDAVAQYSGDRVTFGFAAGNDLRATDVKCTAAGTRFRLNNDLEFFVPLLGRHMAANALAAIAVGRRMNVPDELMIAGLATASGGEMRLQLQEINGVSILNDAYNANPASMRAALETISALPAAGRRVAVLGEMRELGRSTEDSHRQVGGIAAQSRLDTLVCIGPAAMWIAESAIAAGMSADIVSHFPDATAAGIAMMNWVGHGDLVLLKASRSIGLEKIAAMIATPRRMSAAG